jgi:WD40 repeat protein
VRSVAFSADDQFLLTASDDKSVKLWSVGNRKFRGGLQGHSHWVRSAVFGPGDRTVVSGGHDRTAKVRGCASDQIAVCVGGPT